MYVYLNVNVVYNFEFQLDVACLAIALQTYSIQMPVVERCLIAHPLPFRSMYLTY